MRTFILLPLLCVAFLSMAQESVPDSVATDKKVMSGEIKRPPLKNHFKGYPPPLPELQEGWQRIHIGDVGSFDLPPTMEIQGGEYKERKEEIFREMELEGSDVVAQEKGLNEFSQGAMNRYARIMIETDEGTPGEYLKLNYSPSSFTQSDIDEMDKVFREEIQKGLKDSKLGIKIIEWYPLKAERVNQMFCIHLHYSRRIKGDEPVLVHMYVFHNYDRLHWLTLSYTLAQSDYWKSDFETVLKSFRIDEPRGF